MKSVLSYTLGLAAGALIVGSANALTVSSALATATIPAGSVVNAATFSIYVTAGDGSQTVNVHRTTASWNETTVTWANFAGAYDPAVIDTFQNFLGWQTTDLTALVQSWVDGTVLNQGILIEQGLSPITFYTSSDSPDIVHRPMLDIFYTPPGGSMHELVLQRPGATPDTVTDAYIWELLPNYNGNTYELFTGNAQGYNKMSLLQFEFSVDGGNQPGTGTLGYWKNHPAAWPVSSIVIGGISYTKAQAIAWMGTPVAGDKTKTMFAQLVSAKLNVIIGNDSSCIAGTIADADAWMALHPVGSGVGGGSAAWTIGAPIAAMLDDYNNGLLCAPHRN